jgi:hypothetical protein
MSLWWLLLVSPPLVLGICMLCIVMINIILSEIKDLRKHLNK